MMHDFPATPGVHSARFQDSDLFRLSMRLLALSSQLRALPRGDQHDAVQADIAATIAEMERA